MDALNSAVAFLNQWGRVFCGFGARMLIQSSLLVGLLLFGDLCLRARVSARFRYALWLLVLVKLVVPPSLALPTGIAYWLHPDLPSVSVPSVPTASLIPQVSVEPLTSVTAVPTEVAGGDVQAVVPVSESVPLQLPGLILLGWILGAGLLSALVLWQVESVRRSLSRSRPAPGHILALLEECRVDLAISAKVTLRLIDDMRSPAVCGFVRPVILLPAVLLPRLSRERLRAILMHELIHIKRHDPWVSLVQAVLQVAYFWHPLVWLANARLRHLRELAVDETVLVAFQPEAQCYTDTLIDIAEMAFRKPAFSLRVIGIAESRRDLERRITHMLNPHIPKRSALGVPGLLLLVVLGAMLLPMGRPNATAQAVQAAVPSAPALPEGIAEMFQLDKDSILEKFGEPRLIFYGDQHYTLDDLPETYYMPYEDVSFCINEGDVVGVTLVSPKYVFGNGVRVGDSQAEIELALGSGYVLEESQVKDFLTYEGLGLSFEVDKQDRSVMEINIESDYGDPTRLEVYARAEQFIAELPLKIAQLDIDNADLKQVLATFGKPLKYVWESKIFQADQLPNRFIAVYPGSFNVVMLDDRIAEVRHEQGSKYVFAGKLYIGSTLDEALAVLGAPAKIVEGKPIDWQNSANVLFKNIEGRQGHCYYHRPDQNVRIWFGDYKVTAIYMTRTDDSDSDDSPSFDPEFARLLVQRVAALDIDTADLERVREFFGEPTRYLWGSETFTADALPSNYIMNYPCDFSVWMRDGRVMEICHGESSPYVYRNTLRIGSTLQEALDLLGLPDEVVTGQENTFKDKVLYRNLDGNRGYDYYHRADQCVRVWFAGDKVAAIYMTRSDFPVAH